MYHWRIQGAPGMYVPPQSMFFSFSCSFREKLAKIIGWHPHHWGWRPSPRTPGSAAEYDIVIVFSVKAYFVFFRVRSLPEVSFDLHFNDLSVIRWIRMLCKTLLVDDIFLSEYRLMWKVGPWTHMYVLLGSRSLWNLIPAKHKHDPQSVDCYWSHPEVRLSTE